MENIITAEQIDAYCLSLLADERSAGTISKYRRDLTAFARWLDGRTVTKETAAGWKSHLSHRGYAPRTVNSMLASLNGFCRFAGLPIKVKFLKIQRQIFRDSAKELTKEEYDRLLAATKDEHISRRNHHRLDTSMQPGRKLLPIADRTILRVFIHVKPDPIHILEPPMSAADRRCMHRDIRCMLL